MTRSPPPNLSAENVRDFRYKRLFPRCFRWRKQSLRILRRWERSRQHLSVSLPPVDPRRYFDPDPTIFPQLAVRVTCFPVVASLAVLARGVFWVAYAIIVLFHGAVVRALNRHRAGVCRRIN